MIARINRIPLNDSSAVRGRLKHFMSLGAPPMPPMRRGASADFAAEELVAFTVLFGLSQAFVPPVVAARVVSRSWPEIAPLAAAALADDADAPGEDLKVLMFEPRALDGIGAGDRANGRGGVDLGTFRISAVRIETLAVQFGRESAGLPRVILDMAALLAGIGSHLETAGLGEADAAAILNGLRWRAGYGSSEQIVEGRAALRGAEIRLGGRDWYWERAAELLSGAILDDAGWIAYLREPLPCERPKRDAPFERELTFMGALDAWLALGDEQLGWRNTLEIVGGLGTDDPEAQSVKSIRQRLHARLTRFVAKRREA